MEFTARGAGDERMPPRVRTGGGPPDALLGGSIRGQIA